MFNALAKALEIVAAEAEYSAPAKAIDAESIATYCRGCRIWGHHHLKQYETLAKSDKGWKLFFHGELCDHRYERRTGWWEMGGDAIVGNSIRHKGEAWQRERLEEEGE